MYKNMTNYEKQLPTWQNMEMDTGQFRNVQVLEGAIDTSPVQKTTS